MLNTLVTDQCLVVVNDDTLDSINRWGYGKLLNEAVMNLTGHAVHQTSAKYAVAADTANGCVVRNACRLNHMRQTAVSAAERPFNMPAFVSTKLRCAHKTVRTPLDRVESMVTVAERFATTFVSARSPADFLSRLTAAPTRALLGAFAATNTRAAPRDTSARRSAEA